MFATNSQTVEFNLFYIANVFFVEAFMGMDMPNLAKELACSAQGTSRFWSVGINVLYVEKDPCTIYMGLCYVNWSLYYMSLSYVLPFMGIFYVQSSLYYMSLCTKPPGLSCVLLCPFYIRWSLIYRHTYYYESILCTPIILGSYSCT